MEGLPVDTDFSFLLDRKVVFLHIGQFFLHYFLDKEPEPPQAPQVSIQIESDDITWMSEEGHETRITDYRLNAQLLCHPLGLTLVKVSRTQDGGLTLVFSDNTAMTIAIHAPNYESIVLHIGDRAIVG
jgi:hypothetical protein